LERQLHLAPVGARDHPRHEALLHQPVDEADRAVVLDEELLGEVADRHRPLVRPAPHDQHRLILLSAEAEVRGGALAEAQERAQGATPRRQLRVVLGGEVVARPRRYPGCVPPGRPPAGRGRGGRRRAVGDAGSAARSSSGAGPGASGQRLLRAHHADDQPHEALRRVAASEAIDFSVDAGEVRGITGPNGAGKTTFFKMLTCEVLPTTGTILFKGRDITGMDMTEVCQLGLTKSYQVNQLFNRLTARENVTIAALAALRGKFRLDLMRRLSGISGLDERVGHTLELVGLDGRKDTPVAQLAYGEKRRLEIGLALASSPSLLPLDEPLAGMSPTERAETVRLLKSIGQERTMIVIDHDMDSLFELAGRITVLQEGRVLAEGRPADIKANTKVQEAYLGGLNGAGA
jgi:ABC-type branched-subunit amino acid transport system ATPase component